MTYASHDPFFLQAHAELRSLGIHPVMALRVVQAHARVLAINFCKASDPSRVDIIFSHLSLYQASTDLLLVTSIYFMGKQQDFPIIMVLLAVFSCLVLAETQSTPEPETGLEGVISVSPVHGGPSRLGVPIRDRLRILLSS
jgi:hypothetical protein